MKIYFTYNCLTPFQFHALQVNPFAKFEIVQGVEVTLCLRDILILYTMVNYFLIRLSHTGNRALKRFKVYWNLWVTCWLFIVGNVPSFSALGKFTHLFKITFWFEMFVYAYVFQMILIVQFYKGGILKLKSWELFRFLLHFLLFPQVIVKNVAKKKQVVSRDTRWERSSFG